KGGTGIIIPGSFCVDDPNGKVLSNQTRIDRFKFVKDLSRLARSVQSYGALCIPQIYHAGARTDFTRTEGLEPRCVSDVDSEDIIIKKYRANGSQVELTTSEVKDLVLKFIQAAKYCEMAGCDGVELHCAHGYLISQFLSPDTNKRTDMYGGSLDNRMRFALEIIEGIRVSCGKDFIIGARIPGAEYVKNGLSPEDCRKVAVRFQEAGADFLDISIGLTTDLTKIREPQGYPQGARLGIVANIKNAVNIPVMGVGNLKEPDFCDKVIADGIADYVLMARQLICDPDWANKAKSGRSNEIRPCISCGVGCFGALEIGHSIECVLNPKVGYEYEKAETCKTPQAKNVLVIGGGLAGMQAAITAAKRGHNVKLFEKEYKLGGQMNIACVPPHKGVIMKALNWFAEEVGRVGVDIHLGHEITIDDVEILNPDKVIFAAGSKPWDPELQGKQFTVQCWDILSSKVSIPTNIEVTIIGGGIVGCETALLLQQHNNRVTIIERLPEVALGLEGIHRTRLLAELAEGNTKIHTDTRVLSIQGKKIVCQKDDGSEIIVRSGVIILAMGQKSTGSSLAKIIGEKGYDVTVIGDALFPATFGKATKDGYLAAVRI
ncbi:MAG: FAD-dependent oxidoreductase, partial [Clostridiaceae bacterium]|nr:FAD-dependent oxidoreductase [Clostridiaceae bacterium]